MVPPRFFLDKEMNEISWINPYSIQFNHGIIMKKQLRLYFFYYWIAVKSVFLIFKSRCHVI